MYDTVVKSVVSIIALFDIATGVLAISCQPYKPKIEVVCAHGLEQTLQRRSHSPIGESRGATCGTLNGKPILGDLFGARRDVVGDRQV